MTETTKPGRPRKMARETMLAATPKPSATSEAPPQAGARPQTKTMLLLELLQRFEGATLDQLVEATGWLPHSTRAMLTGLRKKGYALTSEKEGDGPRIYRVATDAAEVSA